VILFLWKKIRRWLSPGPASLIVESDLPIAPGETQRRVRAQVKPGKASYLPGVLVESLDGGAFRTRLRLTTRIPSIPGGGFILSMLKPSLRRAFLKKTNQILLPGVTAGKKSTRGLLEGVLIFPLIGPRHSGGPFAPGRMPAPIPWKRSTPDTCARFFFQVCLTPGPVPFEENAALFELYEEARLLNHSGDYNGFVRIEGGRQSTVLPGSGGLLQFAGTQIRLALCDEILGLKTEQVFAIERPFGLGDKLPGFVAPERFTFSINTELDAVISHESLVRAVNRIFYLKTADLTKIIEFIQKHFGLDGLKPDGNPIFVERIQLVQMDFKTLSARTLFF